MSPFELLQKAIAAQRAGRWEEAGTGVPATASREPKPRGGASQSGWFCCNTASPPRRWPTCSKPLNCRRSRVEIQNNLGGLCEQAGDLSEAIEAYRRAAALAPQSPVPHVNWARRCAKRGGPPKPYEPLRTAATLDPNLAEAWAALGAVLLNSSSRWRRWPRSPRRGPAAGGRPVLPPAGRRPAVPGTVRRGPGAVPRAAAAESPAASTPGTAWAGHGWSAAGWSRQPRPSNSAWRSSRGMRSPCTTWGECWFELGCLEQALPLFRQAAEAGPAEVRSPRAGEHRHRRARQPGRRQPLDSSSPAGLGSAVAQPGRRRRLACTARGRTVADRLRVVVLPPGELDEAGLGPDQPARSGAIPGPPVLRRAHGSDPAAGYRLPSERPLARDRRPVQRSGGRD